jgi:hypothetical protein
MKKIAHLFTLEIATVLILALSFVAIRLSRLLIDVNNISNINSVYLITTATILIFNLPVLAFYLKFRKK